MTRALAATLFAALLLIPAAGTHGIKEGGTFRIGIPASQFGSIDPILPNGPGPTALFRATCAGLVRFRDKPLPEGLRVVPEIATAYPTVTNGGKTYTFTIRKGFRFSTGASVTARSFAHTINRLLDPRMKTGGVADYYRDILGAQKVMDGKAETAFGVTARGDTLIIRLKKPVGDFTLRTAGLCVVPEATPIDPEGVRAPSPSAGPYYVAQYLPSERVVLQQNRFYRGARPHHVARFAVDLTLDEATILDRVERNELDYGWVPQLNYAGRAAELVERYGRNRDRFWVMPANNLRMFVFNTSRPLFRENVKLRQSINFAVDRKALLRERGPLGGTLTDQYLPPGMPGYRDERIYPLKAPDLVRAKALARGNLRSKRAVLYTSAIPLGLSQAQIIKDNLSRIGLEVEIKAFPFPVLVEKLRTQGEPFDIGLIGWLGTSVDGSLLNALFEGRTIGQPGFANLSYFNSANYNRALARASRLPIGPERYRTYGELDVDIARNAAPAIAVSYDNTPTLVSARTGCVIVNPELDLAAVCLK